MRFLVTGASGFVGMHLVPRLVHDGDVIALHRPGHPIPDHLGGCQIIETDLATTTPEPFEDIDAVIHLAAEASPIRCAGDPVAAAEINIVGTARMLQAMQQGARFVFVSTGQVFGPTSDVIAEDRTPDPVGVYGATKRAAEILVEAAHRRGDVEGVIVRPFNMYGPGQEGPYVVPDLVPQALHAEEVVMRSLEPARDYTYIEDAAELLTLAATHPHASGETFHLASGGSTSVAELVQLALESVGRNVPVHARTAGDPDDIVRIDPSKADRRLGWRASTPLTVGLAKTLHAYERR